MVKPQKKTTKTTQDRDASEKPACFREPGHAHDKEAQRGNKSDSMPRPKTRAGMPVCYDLR